MAGGEASYALVAGPAFDTVSVATGQVNYRVDKTGGGDTPTGSQTDLVSVQMLSDTQIKVEVFSGNLGAAGVFDSGAQIYNR